MTDGPIQITVDDAELRRVLGDLRRRLGDLTPAMRAIGAELEARISNRFETSTAPSGEPWAEWSESYAEERPRLYPDANQTILDRYGDMLDSLSYEADADSVVIGFGQVYAAYHEWGTRKMPRRGLITADPDTGELAAEDRQAILDILTDLIQDAL